MSSPDASSTATSSRSGLAQLPLKDVAASHRPLPARCRVSKPIRIPRERHRTRREGQQPKVRAFLSECEHRDFLLSITKKLQSITRFANRVLRVQCQQSADISSAQYQLDYPKHRVWRALGDATLPSLSSEQIRQLRDTLVEDLSILYAKHLAYTPDLTTLEIVAKTSDDKLPRTIYRPLIDSLDFDAEANGQTAPWTNLRDKRIQFVKAQFDVLETLSELSKPFQHARLSADLEPSLVAQVLRKHHPLVPHWNSVIRYVRRYSTELGQFVTEKTRDYLLSLPWRKIPPDAPTQKAMCDRCATINHTLGLLDQAIEYRDNPNLQQDRAGLLVVYATLVIHLHAKSVAVLGSRGLLECSGKETADSYMSFDVFNSVVRARRLAEEAIDDMSKQGIVLGREIDWFIRADAQPVLYEGTE